MEYVIGLILAAAVAGSATVIGFDRERSQLRGITFICHRNTKFAPVLLHAVSHIHLRYSGANATERYQACLVPRRLGGLVASVHDTLRVVSIVCSVILGLQDSM
jgi:hypothetical protein